MSRYPLLIARWNREAERAADEARKRREALDRLAPALRQFGVRRAIVFGSTSRGRARPGSDIDLYVEPLLPAQFWELRRVLEEAAGFPVDLHDPSDAPEFVRKIKERGEVFYEA